MNVNELQAKLIAAARKHPPGEQVPYAFEKRILSHLVRRPAVDIWDLWCRPLWQAALSCIAITVVCGFWAYSSRPNPDNADNFSQEFEAAVFAPMSDHIEDSW
ncbi:MAG TPA: hypothetical protein VGR14_14600 [Verrucomicrobiae bacterium]|jgi:hypothetical protein|nr:hypothetical protein [Verrucomicrobiae bacterium]